MKSEQKIVFIPNELELSSKIAVRFYMNTGRIFSSRDNTPDIILSTFNFNETKEGFNYWWDVLSKAIRDNT